GCSSPRAPRRCLPAPPRCAMAAGARPGSVSTAALAERLASRLAAALAPELQALIEDLTEALQGQATAQAVSPAVPLTDLPDVFGMAELQRVVPLGRTTLFELVRRGELPAKRAGKRLLFTRAGVQRWLSTQELEAVTPPASASSKRTVAQR